MAKARNKMQLTSLNAQDEWEEGFSRFIEEVISGNVILIIGKAFELNLKAQDSETGDEVYRELSSFYDYILDVLNMNYRTEAKSLNDLAYDDRFINIETGNSVNVYGEIRRVIDKSCLSIEDVNPKLVELIKTGLFRFVVTTSFDPLVQIAMEEVWGDSLRIMSVRDKNVDNRDIKNELDLNVPTLYYLFGSAMVPGQKYVVTDNDAIEMITYWQSSMAESKFLEIMSRKHILALGCDYDDWLFRFIWYLLRGGNKPNEHSCVADFSINENLEHYLKLHNVLINKRVNELWERIIEDIKVKTSSLNQIPSSPIDIFISYSRADIESAQQLYTCLASKGLKVWFDLYNLGGRGGNFMEDIYRAIDQSKCFILILSDNIDLQKEKEEYHPYRLEWERARNQQIGRGGGFCRPVCINNYNVNEGWSKGVIPLWIKDSDCWPNSNSIDASLESFAEDVYNKLSYNE